MSFERMITAAVESRGGRVCFHCWHVLDSTLDGEVHRLRCCRCGDPFEHGGQIEFLIDYGREDFHGPHVPPWTPQLWTGRHQ